MSTTYKNIWYSGDWEQNPNVSEPYNGIQIKAEAEYEPAPAPKSPPEPPTPRKLISLTLDLIDFTMDPEGVSSTVILYKSGIWYDIPIPNNNTVSPPQPNVNFTITNIDLNGLGQVQLTKVTSGLFLQVQFRYGLEHRTREEIGFIMAISETYIDGQDPIKVSG